MLDWAVREGPGKPTVEYEVPVSTALKADEIVRRWRRSEEAHVTGWDVCPSPIDDNHLLRCGRVEEIAREVGVPYSDTIKVIMGAGLWPWIEEEA